MDRGAAEDLAALARNSLLGLAGAIGSGVLAFLFVVVATRGLQPAARAGVLFETIALFTILSNAAELGADTGVVLAVARYRALRRTGELRAILRIALWPVVAAGILLAAASFAAAPQLSRWLGGDNTMTRSLRIVAPFLPAGCALAVVAAATRGFGTLVPSVGIQSIGVPALRPAMAILVLAAGLGSAAVALAWASPLILGLGAALLALRHLLGRDEARSSTTGSATASRGKLAGEFWRFSASRSLAGILQIAVVWLDVLLVGALRSTREAAIYASASRLVAVGTVAVQALAMAVGPLIATLLAADDRHRAGAVYRTATTWLMVPSWPIYMGMAIFAPSLMRVFGPEYPAGQHAVLILSLAALVYVTTGNNKIVLLMAGKSGWNLSITAASLVLNVGLNLLLIPRYGMNGAAVAFAASIVFDNLATTGLLAIRLGLHPFGREQVAVAGASVLIFGGIGLAVRGWLGTSLPAFLSFAAVATAAYTVLVWRIRDAVQLPALARAVQSVFGADGGQRPIDRGTGEP